MEETLEQKVIRLEAENEALKNKKSVLSLKVSNKGAISLYGIGRFPVTLYLEQWIKVLNFYDNIRQFIEENRDKLSVKEKKE